MLVLPTVSIAVPQGDKICGLGETPNSLACLIERYFRGLSHIYQCIALGILELRQFAKEAKLPRDFGAVRASHNVEYSINPIEQLDFA